MKNSRIFNFPVDKELQNSTLQALKEIMEKNDPRRPSATKEIFHTARKRAFAANFIARGKKTFLKWRNKYKAAPVEPYST